jgi:hypothetical protein
MQNRNSSIGNRNHGEPRPIGEILAELMACYEHRFPTAGIAVAQTTAVMEDQSCLSYRAELANVS